MPSTPYDRRTLLIGLAAVAAVLPLAPVLGAAPLAPDDPRLVNEVLRLEGARLPVKAYLSRPNGPERRPVVILLHDVRGAGAPMEALARRLAIEGFVVLAPDFDETAREVTGSDKRPVRQLQEADVVATLQAWIEVMSRHPNAAGPIGIVGFGWGGNLVYPLCAGQDRLAAAVVYYGRAPTERLKRTKAAFLIHDPAGAKTDVMALEKTLAASGISYAFYEYQVPAGFSNEAVPKFYNRDAAELAWERTLAFLRKHLSPRG